MSLEVKPNREARLGADPCVPPFTCLEGSNRVASGDTRSLGLRPPDWTPSAWDLLFPPELLPQHTARARRADVRFWKDLRVRRL